MTQRGKWVSESAQRYLGYKQEVGWQLKKQFKEPTGAAVAVKIKFYMTIPQGWSKRRKLESIGQPHTTKPDIDNLIKGVFDSANGILWTDDKQVVALDAEKVYGDKPGFEIELQELF